MTEELLLEVKALDPVPADAALPAGIAAAAVVLQAIDERTQTVQTQGRPVETKSPAPTPYRRRPLVAVAAAFVAVLTIGLGFWVFSGGDDVVDQPPITTAVPTTTAAPATTAAPTTEAPATVPPDTTAAPTTVAAPVRPFSAAPVFGFSAGGAITEPGAVVFHDGMWHMFYRSVEWENADGLTGDGLLANIGYATSNDGLSWDNLGVVTTVGGVGIPYPDVKGIRVGSALVSDDGTWSLYFNTFRESGALFSGGVIGRMTAPAPQGPWTADPTPALLPGAPGEWDSEALAYPTVLVVGDQLWMYYDGHRGDLDSGGDRSIGLAFSDDGVTWAKYDDPQSSDGLFATSDPILTTTPGGWDEWRVLDANVVLTDEGFVMTYLTNSITDAKIGVAFSDDGIVWEKSSANPVFDHELRGFRYTAASSLIHTGRDYVLIAELAGTPGTGTVTTVWTWLHEGPIRG